MAASAGRGRRGFKRWEAAAGAGQKIGSAASYFVIDICARCCAMAAAVAFLYVFLKCSFHQGLLTNALQLPVPVASRPAYQNLGFLAWHRHWRRMRGTAGVAREDAAVLVSCCSAATTVTRSRLGRSKNSVKNLGRTGTTASSTRNDA